MKMMAHDLTIEPEVSGQDAFFDVRDYHPNVPSYKSRNLPAVYKSHEVD